VFQKTVDNLKKLESMFIIFGTPYPNSPGC